jgi:homoserine kinase type II
LVNGIPDDVLPTVLDRFGLQGARTERSFAASTRNDNLLVSSASREQLVLRRYRRNRDFSRIEFQLRFQQWLLEAGYPVPRVLPATDGSLLLQTDAGPFALSNFVEGGYYDYDQPAHRIEAGRRLAQFHLLTETFPESMGEYELVQPVREWWTQPERELADIQAFFDGVDIRDELEQVREWLRGLHAGLSLEELDALPAGWIHNDYHGRNVLFDDDRVVALLDYDKIQTAPYALEVAHAIFTFGRPFRGSEDIRLDFVREFLAGYEAVRPLSAAERRATIALMGMELPPFARIYEMVVRDGLDALAAFRANVAGQRARRANAAQLTAAL